MHVCIFKHSYLDGLYVEEFLYFIYWFQYYIYIHCIGPSFLQYVWKGTMKTSFPFLINLKQEVGLIWRSRTNFSKNVFFFF